MKRSRTEVIIEILNAAKNDACKTRLMYTVNMNLASFNKYLRELIRAGLIAKVHGSQDKVTYRITERGKNLLQLLEKAEEFVSL
jgi:predicted transcriptional regulator